MYVYILQTITRSPRKYYTGSTTNLKQRLKYHNLGESKYTSAYRPWMFKNFIWFSDHTKALEFERYLKSGSGRAFANKHF